ncbi:uncharacterized protein [Pseudorasbora parva]|uniref:uncharacterized protein n=1 Tax=Pseudorasbora parva TaxID=51549 RepID=UPI00351EE22A
MEFDTEDQESVNLLQIEGVKDGKGAVNSKDSSELLCHEQDRAGLPRRSERSHIPTEKMLAYQKDECSKKEKKLSTLYEQWKLDARKARHDLKSDISDKQLAEIADSLEDKKNYITKIFSEIREHITPAADLRRKIDACEAVTNDIVKIVLERLSTVDGDFDAEQERSRLHELLAHSYAHSIYGSSASQASLGSRSVSSCTASKRADAAAELAAKEAEYKMMQTERRQKEKVRTMEEQLRKELESQRFELERLQIEKDVEVARARVKSYDEGIKQETKSQSIQNEHESQRNEISSTTPQQHDVVQLAPLSEVYHLAQAVQDSIAINRLPIPEPTVFNGDAIQFVDWKASFMSLIDRKGISAAEKLYYLKKYVSGSAHKYLEGTFYRNDEEAYKDAWNKLNQRYGQPFVIQRAFREKLSKWPRIQSKDAEGLRTFSDFLNACLQAIPHVKGLEILNDCEENQKLVQKLPDWAASRWNRQVTTSLMDGKEFPSFQEFVKFMSTEAEIVCNPITSLHALHSHESPQERRISKETKRNKAIVFKTQTTVNSDKPTVNRQLKVSCMLCQDANHPLCKCPKFMEKSLKDRRSYVKDNKLCYGCMKPGHFAKECRRRHTCDVCKLRHPTCLHDYNYDGNRKLPTVSCERAHESEVTDAMSLNITSEGHSTITSMIVPVWVSSVKNPSNEQLVYALLDTQSDTTFIDEEISKVLQMDTQPIKLKLTTMMGDNMIIKSKRVSNLRVRGYNSSVHINLPPVYTKECIPVNRDHIPTQETAKNWSHLKVITDEMSPLLSCEVGLLIGYNCPRVLAPRQVILGKEDEPYAILTDLGWSIVGCSTPGFKDSTAVSLCHRIVTKEIPAFTPVDVIRVLESDFKDITSGDKTISQEDIMFLDKLKEGIKKDVQGHYEMPLPFKQRPYLPDNRELAKVRLHHLNKKFCKNEKYKTDYITYMNDIIERGDVETVNDDGTDGEKWYIPHHGIYHPKKPDKLRVVFDCSAKFKGTSLNEHLLTGPDMINNLTGVLVRFRRHPIAIICDIEKMFHQFHVQENDRDYLRFLWWKDGDTNSALQDYRMKVHLFGAVSSPGCANYGLRYLASEHSQSHSLAAQFIARDFYVDDGVASVETVEIAIQLAKETRELCAKGGLRLHKFISNDNAVLQSIPASERAINFETKDLTFNDMPIERALGIHWNIQSDSFKFHIPLSGQPTTRRGILSTVASIYDPLGFVAPYVLNGKRILQEMCRQGTGWDDPLSPALSPLWERWQNDFINLERVNIPRCYAPAEFGKIVKTEIHHFSDASTCGYGQCSYLRMMNEKDEIHCTFLIGKARVTPVKITTIPRLELTAAVVSVQMSNLLREELDLTNANEFFWTDSKVVLGYINNDARRFHTFVANRVQKIHQSTAPKQWLYVPTDENPADNASRGRTINELLSSNWFSGPSFLWKKEMAISNVVPELPVGDPEVRKVQTFQTETTESKDLVDHLSKFSSWSNAVKAIARLLRRIRKDKTNSPASVSEQEDAKCLILKGVQKQGYQKEMEVLSQGKQLPGYNKLHHLDAFIDTDGMIKVGGRLSHSSCIHSFKHPLILPKDHHVTKLIIAHSHESVKHQGKGFTINDIRSCGYWIPGINRAVTSYIRTCVTCRRLRKSVEGQRMSDLPTERVEPSPPFVYCGMDCFGPFMTKEGRKQHKRYGLLLTCFCSRAIHIEMLEDMSTDAFINSLRCFIAIRGTVRQIRCDQGTNFVGAKNELNSALQQLDPERLTAFLADKQCDFVMNAPHSSHAGGVWERQIKTVRSVLNATVSLSSGRLNDASLRTLFYEAMAIVNSRPLSVDNLNDPKSLEPLTPNHLITMKATTALPPPGKFIREDVYGKKRWRRVQYLTEQFWSRWKKEYLHNIATRQCWHAPKRNFQIGDVVMDTDETLPRNEWRLGRIIDTVTSQDGLVRKVTIALGDKKLNKKGGRVNKVSKVERPAQKLVLLLEAE